MKKILCVIFLLACPLTAWAERHIHVNGEHLNLETMLMMDQIFGYQVDDGYYWLNTQTGQWGYENNNEIQGTVQMVIDYQQEQASYNNNSYQDDYNEQSNTSYYPTEINSSQNGSVVSGTLNGQNCTFVSVGGMTVKDCD